MKKRGPKAEPWGTPSVRLAEVGTYIAIFCLGKSVRLRKLAVVVRSSLVLSEPG